MKDTHLRYAIVALGAVIIITILGSVLFSINTTQPAEQRPVMTITTAPSEKIITPGSAPDLYSICWRGLVFMSTGVKSGIIQVQDTTGKPLAC